MNLNKVELELFHALEDNEIIGCHAITIVDNVITRLKTRQNMDKLDVKILNNSGFDTPSYATGDSAGVDLRAFIDADGFPHKGKDYQLALLDDVQSISIAPNGRVLIPTGIKLEIPRGYEGQVRARSGAALKLGITMANGIGTIDADYRGDIGLIVHNISNDIISIKHGDRIGQLVFNKIEVANFITVDGVQSTIRGEGGYGHTGKD